MQCIDKQQLVDANWPNKAIWKPALGKATKNVQMFRQVAKTVSYKFFVTLSSSRKRKILIFVTVADWDIMGRVITQGRGQAF